MSFDRIEGLVIAQITLAVMLAVVLRLLFARLGREQHLGFWALSWAASAVYVTCVALYAGTYQRGGSISWVVTEVLLLGVAASWFQPACMVLAAWSLRSGRVGRREVLLTIGGAFLLGLAWSRTGASLRTDPLERMSILVAPRAFLYAGGLACYALFFRRYYSRARSFSGWLTIGFCLAYALHLVLYGLDQMGVRSYVSPTGLLNAILATVMPMGIALGIIISVMEQAERSEGAVSSVWSSSVPMRLTDPEGFVVRVNPAFCTMMARTAEQIEGRLFTDCYDESAHGQMLSRYRTRFAERAVEPRMHRTFQRWDGKVIKVELTNAFVETPSGPQLLSLMQDVTREHEATEALQRSEERLQLLLDSITDSVFDFRIGGQAALVPRYSEMLGYAPGELEPTFTTWLRLLHPDDRAALPRDPLDSLGSSGGLTQMEYRLRHKSGRWVWIRSVAKVIERDAAGRPLRVVGTMTNIDAIKAAEAETRRLEGELLQTRKMEAIGRLAGGVAHDFNNHLTVINGYCDLLISRTSDENLRDKLRQIREAGGRAAGLTRQLLAVSRRQPVQPQSVQLNAVVSESGEMLHRLIGENIEIVTRLDSRLGLVQADPGQMHQVLMNLTLNARDAMPRGGRITIETANVAIEESTSSRPRDSSPGVYACLSVRDTGHGMSPEIQERIFEPFFTTKPSGAGTGLGLSTVYGIVQQAGGWLAVESTPGEGSIFRIYLPISGQPPEVSPAEQPAQKLAAGTETILVVEDQDDLRQMSVEILREKGYHLLEAGSGEEALSVAAAYDGPIHLLFIDVVMPGMTGPELAARIRDRRPATRVLYTSGYPQGGDAVLLSKPFSPEELCRKVREVLDHPVEHPSILVVDDEEPIRLLLREILTDAGYQVLEANSVESGVSCVDRGGLSLVITDMILDRQDGLDILRYLHRSHPEVPSIVISGAAHGTVTGAATHLGARAVLGKPVDPDQLLAVVRPLVQG